MFKIFILIILKLKVIILKIFKIKNYFLKINNIINIIIENIYYNKFFLINSIIL